MHGAQKCHVKFHDGFERPIYPKDDDMANCTEIHRMGGRRRPSKFEVDRQTCSNPHRTWAPCCRVVEHCQTTCTVVSQAIQDIPNQKDSKSHGMILQLCTEKGIQVQATGVTEATKRLQRFFRVKQARKKTNAAVDLKQVRFHEDTFAVNGKSVMPQQ